MARVYTERLAIGQATPAGGAGELVYTVPVGKVVILRDFVLVPGSTGGGALALLVYSGAVRVGVAYYLPSPGETVTYHEELRQVLHAGESLHVYVGAGYSWYMVTGYVFDAI